MKPQPPEQPQPPNAGLSAPPPIDPALLGGVAPPALAGSVPAGSTTGETILRWLKESVAALMGLSLMACLLFMLRSAFDHLTPASDKDVSFERVKDLLLFVNPLVGIVIGYYFNRVSTEARAENAERTAQGAAASALQSEAARGQAQTLADKSKAEADAAKSALGEVIPAAETLLSQTAAEPEGVAGVAGFANADGDLAAALAESRFNLRLAVERARAVARS